MPVTPHRLRSAQPTHGSPGASPGDPSSQIAADFFRLRLPDPGGGTEQESEGEMPGVGFPLASFASIT